MSKEMQDIVGCNYVFSFLNVSWTVFLNKALTGINNDRCLSSNPL